MENTPCSPSQSLTNLDLLKASYKGLRVMKEATLSYVQEILVLLAGATIAMSGLVRTTGFSFPTTDLGAGVNLELSRLLYGLGLVVAGVASDRDRRYGMLFCTMALVMPFLMLALSGAEATGAPLWALGYFLTGFYMVFDVLLAVDLTDWVDAGERVGAALLTQSHPQTERLHQTAGHTRQSQRARLSRTHVVMLGLSLGRLGEALGTALCLTFSDEPVALIAVSTVLFCGAMALFLMLYQRLYLQVPLSGLRPNVAPAQHAQPTPPPPALTEAQPGSHALAEVTAQPSHDVRTDAQAPPVRVDYAATQGDQEGAARQGTHIPEGTQRIPSERQAFERFASLHGLTARERDVLRLVLAERSNSEIAGELYVTEATVKYHVGNLLKKTGCTNRLEILALYAKASEE